VTVRVVVADDSELLRAGLVTVLSSHPDIEVVAEAANGVDAAEYARQLAPDVVLMDIEMPGGDGITATRSIVSDCADTRVLVLTMFDLDDYVLEALRAGASGFLLKTSPPQPLIQSVLTCAAGHATLDASVMRRLATDLARYAHPEPAPGTADLTPRERDVLRSLAQGRSNSEIARDLYLAETTVKTHIASILAKLGARDRVQAVVVAHRSGLAGPL
jgi:DNA-binding NarL/FixJ family response regulator